MLDNETIVNNNSTSYDRQILPYILTVSCIIGTIENVLVILLISLNFLPKKSYWHQLRRRNNSGNTQNSENVYKFDPVADTFILALAINDLLACLTVVPLTAYMDTHEKSPSFFICNLFYFFLLYFPAFSSLILSLIAIDRFIFLCFPFIKWFTVKRVVGITLAITVINGVLSCTFAILILERKTFIEEQICTTVDSPLVAAFYKLNNFLFLLLIFIVVACYLSIYIVLLRAKRRLKQFKTDVAQLNGGESSVIEKYDMNNSKSRKKSTFLFFIVVFSFILCYGISLIGIQLETDNKIIFNLYLFIHAINPFIDIIMNKRFRHDLIPMLKMICPCFKASKTYRDYNIPRRQGPKLTKTCLINPQQPRDIVDPGETILV